MAVQVEPDFTNTEHKLVQGFGLWIAKGTGCGDVQQAGGGIS